METKGTKKLSVKMLMYCIVFVSIMSVAIGGWGCYSYYSNSNKHYRMYMESLLRIASDMIDGDDMEQCIRNLTKSNTYKQTQLRLDSIKSCSRARYVYIVYPIEDGKADSIMYVLSAYTQKQREETGETTTLGEDSGDDFPNNVANHFFKAMTGEKEASYVLDKSKKYGDMLTGTFPIENANGERVALLAVDISIKEMQLDLLYYMITVFIGTLVLCILFLVIFIKKINEMVVWPIIKLATHADTFVSQNLERKTPSQIAFQELDIHRDDEIGILSGRLNHLMKALTEYMVNLEFASAQREHLATELTVARQIQSGMLPCIFPAFPERTEFDIYAFMQPAKEVGGDFYDFFLIDETHLGIVIADVSDKGIPAALFMVITRTLIKNYAKLGLEPAKVFVETNNQLSENNETEMSVNAFMGIVDLYNGQFTYVNAGDHTPLLKRAGSGFECLTVKNGFVLAGMEKVPYSQEKIQLMQGDMLCLFTNGVKEVKDKKGESYGRERLAACLNQSVLERYELVQLLADVKKDMHSYLTDDEQTEDITVMLFRYFGI